MSIPVGARESSPLFLCLHGRNGLQGSEPFEGTPGITSSPICHGPRELHRERGTVKPGTRVIWTVISAVGLLMAGCMPGATPAGEATATSSGVSAAPGPDVVTTWPTATSTPTAMPTKSPATPTPQVGGVTFTVLFDNYAHGPDMETEWGFACLVETEARRVLFDTGSNGAILLRNMTALGQDPTTIDAVVFSHYHADHMEGLEALLDTGVSPSLYALSSFPASFKDGVRSRGVLVEVTEPMELFPGFWTTGSVSRAVAEQALVVQTSEGWVVVTGCAHPGVVEMVEQAGQATGGEIALVMGGFHLRGSSRGQVEGLIAQLRALGVQKVGPTHCTGDDPRAWFAAAFGENCIPIGVGSAIVIEP